MPRRISHFGKTERFFAFAQNDIFILYQTKKADTVVSAFNLRYKLYLRDINYFAASAASWIASRNADMEIVQEALRSSAAGVSV